VTERRRHRLIWTAVAGVHLAAVAAVWMGGAVGVGEASREGGLVLVTLMPEPVAMPGEAQGGVALGAGLPISAAPTLAKHERAITPPVVALPSAPVAEVAVPSPGPVLAAAPAPVAEIFVPPAFLLRQEPAYPERARRAGAEGIVGVRIALAADGSVRQVELTRTSGSRLLDEAALAAARASTFTPATRNRSAVESEAEACYRFELR